MRRYVMPFFAMIALLFSTGLTVPDVHAGQGESFAHAADHIYAHGTEHFGSEDSDADQDKYDHSGDHHHNCSFNLNATGPLATGNFWQMNALKSPLCASPLISRTPSVPKQPPKA